MRIRSKIALVGGIPITIAAAIAVAAWLLLTQADRARSGAVLAGAAYRDLLTLMAARDDYIAAQPAARREPGERFAVGAQKAAADLAALLEAARTEAHREAVARAAEALRLYEGQMTSLASVTSRNDRLIADMEARADALVTLTDQARQRQRASNADILTSIGEGDRKLRVARNIVDQAQELRAAFLSVEAATAALPGDGDTAAASRRLGFARTRLRNAATELSKLLRAGEQSGVAAELDSLLTRYDMATRPPGEPSDEVPNAFGDWVDRLIKINSTEQRALHDEVAELLAYSVRAAETEQATQTIAIETLKLGARSADALTRRDADATGPLIAESRQLGATMKALPISPLIQAEMIDSIDRWREGLATTGEGLRDQNALISAMDRGAAGMIAGASALDEMLAADADRIGQFVRTILLIGAAVGLLLGTVTALVVARSITRPLRKLQKGMISLAEDPSAGLLASSGRNDELGAMAGAANFFVTEIGRREQALRQAKEQADETLHELRETQANLIQAEKLASLGQLVAGVAHEINTPIGVALTTSTALEHDVRKLGASIESGRILRSELVQTTGRLAEGTRLIFANLERAVDLIHSFKQVAADQASGERRSFEMRDWLHDLMVSLGPVLRKRGHEVAVNCPEGLTVDGYPGALAQVLTNLVMNAVVHAYPEGQAGHMTVTVTQPRPGWLRIRFEDDGRGIASEHLGKVFDPFFTTRRDRGSTGLGLHIVYNLVTVKLQGRIELESQLGRGACFVIDLPATIAETAEPPSAAA